MRILAHTDIPQEENREHFISRCSLRGWDGTFATELMHCGRRGWCSDTVYGVCNWLVGDKGVLSNMEG